MAMGLRMTNAEWEDLKAQVDDSFWVLRIIGLLGYATISRVLNLKFAMIPPLPRRRLWIFLWRPQVRSYTAHSHDA